MEKKWSNNHALHELRDTHVRSNAWLFALRFHISVMNTYRRSAFSTTLGLEFENRNSSDQCRSSDHSCKTDCKLRKTREKAWLFKIKSV